MKRRDCAAPTKVKATPLVRLFAWLRDRRKRRRERKK